MHPLRRPLSEGLLEITNELSGSDSVGTVFFDRGHWSRQTSASFQLSEHPGVDGARIMTMG
jgi:hypothetical protein